MSDSEFPLNHPEGFLFTPRRIAEQVADLVAPQLPSSVSKDQVASLGTALIKQVELEVQTLAPYYDE